MPQSPFLSFESSWWRDLPGESFSSASSIPHLTPGVLMAEVRPRPVSQPKMLIWSESAGALLDLLPPTAETQAAWSQIFAGNELPSGVRPWSSRYGGHQFGHWAGQLGDGRAISLGEIRNRRGERWEVQLKGAGPTPYSRGADGRAVLRSSLREFLCSEAMFHLGIPTTRALCCVTTGDSVVRDLFYDGHPRAEPGAITTRLAPSFLRFGHFEILAAQNETDNLKTLVAYTLRHYFPDLLAPSGDLSEHSITQWFEEVCRRTANLICEWLRVGFVHGVMNTDNMSILGLTLDYGPYGWLDVFDPQWTPNTTDAGPRRYRFAHQPNVAFWNLIRLAESLTPLLTRPEALEQGLDIFRSSFDSAYRRMMFAKLGLSSSEQEGEIRDLETLDQLLQKAEVDMTLFFRLLITLPLESSASDEVIWDHVKEVFYADSLPLGTREAWRIWLREYQEKRRLELSRRSSTEIEAAMCRQNPVFILRNYLVQEALDGLEQGDACPLQRLIAALQDPYEMSAQTRPFFKRRPEWARHKPGSSALSCSS